MCAAFTTLARSLVEYSLLAQVKIKKTSSTLIIDKAMILGDAGIQLHG